MLKRSSFFVVAVFCVGIFVFPSLASAQERSYDYGALSFSIAINENSTVNVEETQVYDFHGQYHVGWRSIPLKGVSSISDIAVVEQDGGKPLAYSSSRLDKLNPASWGRYTTFVENGSQNIEWYYNLADTSHAWILRYKLHGAIAFYKDYDELYWNLFTNYDVPVKDVSGEVVLPQKVAKISDLTSAIYVDAPGQRLESGGFSADQKFNFAGGNFPPKGMFTIAVGWPKGIVPYSAYVTDMLSSLWGWWAGGIVVLLAFLWVFYIQYVVPKREGRGTIVAEYEPPEHLPPAMAELLVKEKLTPKAWPATVVDLAVRGHLTIEDQSTFSVVKVIGVVFGIVSLGFIFFIFSNIFSDFSVTWQGLNWQSLILLCILPVVIAYSFWARFKAGMDWHRPFYAKEYILRRQIPDSHPTSELKFYEKEFLFALFGSGDTFSTKEMKGNPTKSRAFGIKMLALSKKLYKETEDETAAYASSVSRWQNIVGFVGVAIVLLIILPVRLGSLSSLFSFLNGQGAILLVLTLVAVAIAVLGWFNPRLNKRGELLKEDWLGFKLYLETAERYRMQNLTPELFEKYLPYAMIFGIEKKWAKAFATINMNPPSWYTSSTPVSGGFVSGNSSGVSAASFSPGAFAAGFSASFASSFGGAGGGGGASGGGGGAGGGGGGGGGGAG